MEKKWRKYCCNYLISFLSVFFICNCTSQPKISIYQLKIYHVNSAEQERRTHDFLKTAFMPASHRLGIPKIGVFQPINQDTFPSLIYVFIPYASFEEFKSLDGKLLSDELFLKSGKEYLEANHDNPPYDRIESILMSAFAGMPNPYFPDHSSAKNECVYELRSYEGPTERYYKQKVKMFNQGDEISIFKRLGFNAVFYGEVVAGSRMPNLMYMTTFKSIEDRDELWEQFNNDSNWLTLKSMDEYKNSVSRSDIFLLRPVAYSDY